MNNANQLEELTWDELEQAVNQLITADGPNTDELPIDDFFTLWAQFDAERRQRVIEVKGEIVGEEMVLSLASSNIDNVKIEGHEIQLPDGTRIVLNLKPLQPIAA